MSITFYFLRGLKKVLLHTYVVAGRRLLKNTVKHPLFDLLITFKIMQFSKISRKSLKVEVTGRPKFTFSIEKITP